MPRSAASARDDGSRVPVRRRPARMASRSAPSGRPAPWSRTGPGAGPRRPRVPWPMFLPQKWTLPWAALAHSVGVMTMTNDTAQIPVRVDFDSLAAGYSRAMSHLDHAATKELDKAEIDPRLRELIRIRASQLNGCAYCIDMHTRDARAIGETEQRIYGLAAWRETPYFTARERAALAFTETVTRLSETHVPEQAYQDVAAEFSPLQVAALVSLIVTINAWNAIGVSTRAWAPGSYSP